MAADRPKVSPDRPKTGVDRPQAAGERPKVGGDRPTTPGGNRPAAGTGAVADRRGGDGASKGQLNDFLDLPGKSGGGERPSIGERPKVGDVADNRDRPKVGDRKDLGDGNKIGDRTKIGDNAKIGDSTKIGDRTRIGDNTKVGDVNVNVGNKVEVNRNRENNVNSIRNKWTNVDQRPFDNNWWGSRGAIRDNPSWRWQAGWNRYPTNWCWSPCTAAACGPWFGWAAATPPIRYNYGTNVVYRDNYVYINDQQVAPTEVYYQEAATIAQSVPAEVDQTKVDWMPLGVYAIAEQDATDTGMLIQLAVSKEGIIAGTFHNDTADVARPVEGMVDQKTQRAVWRFADGQNPDIVMETSIYNLTEDDTTALVHFGPDKTQTWSMIRLPAPEEGGTQ